MATGAQDRRGGDVQRHPARAARLRRPLAARRPGAHLINIARVPIVDEAALLKAWYDGRIAATLDVFDREPPAADHPLFQLPNVVVTPHIAAGTVDALRIKMGACFANMRRVVAGMEPENRIS